MDLAKFLPCVSHGLCWFPNLLVSCFHLDCDPTAHLLPLPRPFNLSRVSCVHSSPMLVSHLQCVNPSPNARRPPPPCSNTTACLPLPPCPVKPERSFPTSIMSIRARALVSRLHCLKSSPNAHSHLHHVHSSPHARHPPPPCPLERKRSFPTSIASNRARTLVSHLRRVHSSPHARHPPPPCLLECKRSFPTSIASNRARTLIITTSIRAQLLVSCFLPPSYLFLRFLDRF